MKNFLILFSLLFFKNSFGQSAENCGLDDSPFLTEEESNFLNNYLRDSLNVFDFKSKKVIFITGNTGTHIGTKSEYFRSVRKWRARHDEKIASSFMVFDEDEINSSGGYHAIITYWVKVMPKNRKKRSLKTSKTVGQLGRERIEK